MKIASTTRPSPAGHLSHQRPSLLHWAPFEAAGCAARHSSPDHTYYSRSPAESTTTAPASRSQATLPPRAPQPPRARRRRTRPLPTLPAHSSTPPPNRTRPRPRSHRCPCGQLPPHPRRDHGSPRTGVEITARDEGEEPQNLLSRYVRQPNCSPPSFAFSRSSRPSEYADTPHPTHRRRRRLGARDPPSRARRPAPRGPRIGA